MKIATYLSVLLAATLLATGCFEIKTIYTINPDASGKAEIDYVAPLISVKKNLMEAGNDDSTPLKTQLAQALARIINDTSGVDAWKDVSCKFTKNGKLHFHGTAYFPDYNQFRFFNRSESDSGCVLKRSKGTLTLTSSSSSDGHSKKSRSKKRGGNSLLRQKVEYQNAKPILRLVLNDMKISETYFLPGKIVDAKGFVKSSGGLTRAFNGKKVMAMLDKMAASGKFDDMDFSNLKNDSMALALSSLDSSAKCAGPLTPRFDYKKEVAKAKAEWAVKSKKLLGASAPFSADLPKNVKGTPISAGKLKSPSVAWIELTLAKNASQPSQDGFMPRKTELKLAIAQPLPFRVTAITDAKTTKALAGDGENILGDRDWDREIHFPKLSKDGRTVLLETQLKAPSNLKRGIKTLEGVMTCVSSSGEKKIDLGLLAMKAGSKGKKLGAKIVKAGKGIGFMDDKSSGLSLHLALSKNDVIGFEFQDASGKPLKFDQNGCSYSDNSSTFMFSTKGPLPKQARVFVKVYGKSKKQEIPFKIENVNLLGK